MKERNGGKLKSGTGKKVKSRKQASQLLQATRGSLVQEFLKRKRSL
jgi:hypothetical protein